jgi:hypothetical protein
MANSADVRTRMLQQFLTREQARAAGIEVGALVRRDVTRGVPWDGPLLDNSSIRRQALAMFVATHASDTASDQIGSLRPGSNALIGAWRATQTPLDHIGSRPLARPARRVVRSARATPRVTTTLSRVQIVNPEVIAMATAVPGLLAALRAATAARAEQDLQHAKAVAAVERQRDDDRRRSHRQTIGATLVVAIFGSHVWSWAVAAVEWISRLL